MEETAPQKTNHSGYARMPRIIRKGYKHLTKLQKLLYIYLRDICGEHGVCYRSLRSLAQETDFSLGYLSENIPVLEQAGLILAEKKKRNGKKWEVWHITIVDIWEQNTLFLQAEKCSQDEQMNDHHTNSSHDERNCTQSVHGTNENAQKCSRGAYKEEVLEKKNPLLDKEVSTVTDPPAPSSSLFSAEEETFRAWLKEEQIIISGNDQEIKEHLTFVMARVQTREQLHNYCDYAREFYKNWDNTKVYLANLAKDWLLKKFLKAQPVEQAFVPPQPERAVESLPSADIEALVREIQNGYPELLLRVGEDEYGAYIDVVYGDGDQECETVRDGQEWARVVCSQKRMERVLEYGRQRCVTTIAG